MASTTLFAPQVRSVQPAFIYNEESGGIVKIYFSLSDFNIDNDFNKVKLTLIDPNIESTWGTNSMIKDEKEYLEFDKNSIELINDEYILSVDVSDFKTLKTNQYYQAQLILMNDTEESLPSQATLIRPISQNEVTIEQNGKSVLRLTRLDGNIKYDDESTIEAIESYYFKLIDYNGNVKYTSKNYFNTLGTVFRAKFDDCYLESGAYVLKFYYTTINGFSGTIEDATVTIGAQNTEVLALINPSVFNNLNTSSIELGFSFGLTQGTDLSINSGILRIDRADDEYSFLNWQRVYESKEAIPMGTIVCWADFSIENGKLYKYRISLLNGNTEFFATDFIEVVSNFEDIFLTEKDRQLAIRFNPNISGFKWVTQESITNTIGGKFPVIRVNGDTKYRQFSLSGTLSFEQDANFLDQPSLDSRDKYINSFFPSENNSLFFNINKATELFTNFINPANCKAAIQQRFRKIALDFLTNQKPKLFRSPTEGSMIVYLSNVSFTPNKTLGRDIYDFSATVSEICEFSYENLQKYDLLIQNSIVKNVYILNAEKTEYKLINNVLYLIPYLTSDNVYIKENEIQGPLITEKTIMELQYE